MEKQVKLLATDLDGTLFYPKRRVNLIAKKNRRFLDRFREEGNKIVFVTGRSPEYANKVFDKLGYTVDVIGMNGAYTIVDGEVTNEHFLDFDIRALFKDVESRYPLLGKMLISRKYPLLIATSPIGNFIRTFYSVYYWSQGGYAENYHFSNEEYEKELDSKEVYKLMLFFGLSKKKVKMASEVTKFLRDKYPGKFEASWSNGFIEITPHGSSKSFGLDRYIKSKNISPDNVYVVGDSGNDISMFNSFYERSFCMKHSHKKVKKYAKTILRRFHHLSRYI